MGILFCVGNSIEDIFSRYDANEHVLSVNFEYDERDKEIFKDLDLFPAILRELVTADPYDDTVFTLDVITIAEKGLELLLPKSAERSYYDFLCQLHIILQSCIRNNSMLIAIGD